MDFLPSELDVLVFAAFSKWLSIALRSGARCALDGIVRDIIEDCVICEQLYLRFDRCWKVLDINQE